MSSEWPTVTIQNLIDDGVIIVHKDGNHGSNYPRTSEFGDEGVPFLTAKLLDDSGNIDFLGAPRLSSDKANKFKFGFVESQDVLLSHNATVGRVAVVPEIEERVLIGTSLTQFRLDSSRLLPQYLAAYFSGLPFQNQLAAVMSQTTRNQVPITSQRKLSVVVPSMDVQTQIAAMLGTFENKIRNISRINQTLEEIAQAIFKSWFVDFDPVKAKMETLAAGGSPADAELAAMSVISAKTVDELNSLKESNPEAFSKLQETAALFPSAMQESELGLIPKGWDIKPFSKLAKLDTTSVKPNSCPDKVWEHFSIPAFDTHSSPSFELGKTIKSGKYKVNRYSILSSKLNPHFPRTWWPDVEDDKDAICSTEFMQFVPIKEDQRSFIYGMIVSAPFQQGILARVTGSTGSRQRAQPPQVANMDVLVPDDSLILAYSDRIHPLHETSAKNIKLNLVLSNLRDTLLPKLLSGEIDLSSEAL